MQCTIRTSGANQFGGSGQTSWPGDPQRGILWSLIRWVEQGAAPETITAARIENGVEQSTRRLCRFPASLSFGADPEGVCAPDPVLQEAMQD